MPAINSLKVHKFKRFSNFDVSLEAGVTIISGSNGTGKSSLLHLVSNTFQRPAPKHLITDQQSRVLSDMRGILNLRIDKLSRGDKANNDPTGGVKGDVYSASGDSFDELVFRRHQTRQTQTERYYLKPYYKNSGVTTMPPAAVAYLGLSRLVPQGEVDDSGIHAARLKVLDDLSERVKENYKNLTLLDIQAEGIEQVAGIKERIKFSTPHPGVDSNTISAGQDNVLVLLSAMEHLAAFRRGGTDLPALMLVDEFDATLHPDLQVRLLSLMAQYATEYGIQFLLTTQLMDLIEFALNAKEINMIYLVNNGSTVFQMQDPSPLAIRMHLNNHTVDTFGKYQTPKIAVFTEDAEARLVMQWLLDFCRTQARQLAIPTSSLRYIDVNLGAEQLKSLFSGEAREILSSAICILDGDKGNPRGMNKSFLITCLPGEKSPEAWLLDYAKLMIERNAPQFMDREWLDNGYTSEAIQRKIKDFEDKIDINSSTDSRTKNREIYKQFFNANVTLFQFLCSAWCRDKENAKAIIDFVSDFGRVYQRAAKIAGAPDLDWSDCINTLRGQLHSAP